MKVSCASKPLNTNFNGMVSTQNQMAQSNVAVGMVLTIIINWY